MKAYVQVKSKSELGILKNLSYQAKGPFIVTKDLHHSAFDVKPYNRLNVTTLKYKATELYLVPPVLYSSEPLETIDQWYLIMRTR